MGARGRERTRLGGGGKGLEAAGGSLCSREAKPSGLRPCRISFDVAPQAATTEGCQVGLLGAERTLPAESGLSATAPAPEVLISSVPACSCLTCSSSSVQGSLRALWAPMLPAPSSPSRPFFGSPGTCAPLRAMFVKSRNPSAVPGVRPVSSLVSRGGARRSEPEPPPPLPCKNVCLGGSTRRPETSAGASKAGGGAGPTSPRPPGAAGAASSSGRR